jgi:hypothetical protein
MVIDSNISVLQGISVMTPSVVASSEILSSILGRISQKVRYSDFLTLRVAEMMSDYFF